MSFVGTSYARMVTCGILILGHAVLQAEEGANPLRYRFEKGQSVVYSVRLEAEFEDYCEVFSGLPRFTVQEVKPKENRLTFRGALEPSQVPKADRQGRHPLYYQSGALSLTGVGFPQTSRSSDVSVDSLGREVARKGSSQLPFLLGNLSELILPPVPEALGEDWTKTREVEIKLSESYLRHPLQRDENSKSLSTSEKFTYHTVKQEGDLVTLQKTYEMSTSQLVKNRPRIEMAGVGHLTFDRQRGVFTSMEHELNLTLRETYVTREIPIKIRCTLLDDAAVTQADQEARRPLNADELEAVLLDLSSKERGLGRILQLQQKAPAQPNPEVGTALAGYLKHTDPNTRYAAAAALELWSTASDAPALVEALNDATNNVRFSVLKTLARLKPTDALATALKMLGSEEQGRVVAVEALKSIGAPAEAGLIELLKSPQWMVRYEALKLLKEYGSEASLAPLKPMHADDEQALLRNVAGEAIEAIKKRSK